MTVPGDRPVEDDPDSRVSVALSTSVGLGDVPNERTAVGDGSPIVGPGRLCGAALTGSPGLLFLLESTGFVSTGFTDESPASAALLSPAWAAAEELALPCVLAPERSTPTAPCPDPWAEAPAWLWEGGLCAGGFWADVAPIANAVATAKNTAGMYVIS